MINKKLLSTIHLVKKYQMGGPVGQGEPTDEEKKEFEDFIKDMIEAKQITQDQLTEENIPNLFQAYRKLKKEGKWKPKKAMFQSGGIIDNFDSKYKYQKVDGRWKAARNESEKWFDIPKDSLAEEKLNLFENQGYVWTDEAHSGINKLEGVTDTKKPDKVEVKKEATAKTPEESKETPKSEGKTPDYSLEEQVVDILSRSPYAADYNAEKGTITFEGSTITVDELLKAHNEGRMSTLFEVNKEDEWPVYKTYDYEDYASDPNVKPRKQTEDKGKVSNKVELGRFNTGYTRPKSQPTEGVSIDSGEAKKAKAKFDNGEFLNEDEFHLLRKVDTNFDKEFKDNWFDWSKYKQYRENRSNGFYNKKKPQTVMVSVNAKGGELQSTLKKDPGFIKWLTSRSTGQGFGLLQQYHNQYKKEKGGTVKKPKGVKSK